MRNRIFNLFFDFEGRGSRTEFWTFLVCTLAIGLAFAVLDALLGWHDPRNNFGYLGQIFLVVAYVPTVVAIVRRFHDIDLSGWWILSLFIPLAGLVMLLVLMCWRPTRGINSYGYR